MSSGQDYEATLPDTLDLAERAALAVNALTGAADPEQHYETYHCGHLDHNPPYMNHVAGGRCMMKAVHALPLMRTMSGSRQNADYDLKMVEACIREVEDDGIWWFRVKDRPGRLEMFGGDHTCVPSQGRLMVALMDLYKYDGDSRWLEITEHMAAGLSKLGFHSGDRTWYSDSYTCGEEYRGSWNGMVLLRKDSTTPEQPEPGFSDMYSDGAALRAFSLWHAVSGDKDALNTAHRVARNMLKMSIGENEPDWPSMIAGKEQGFWSGHFHSWTMGMKGMVEYAAVTNDPAAKRYVSAFFNYARYHGIGRIGFFPAVIGDLAVFRQNESFSGQPCEGCCVGDMVWLAARMSEVGIGDYWEDVDQYVRNHLVEHQWTDRDLLRKMVEVGPEHKLDPRIETDDNVLERNVGAFCSTTDPTWGYGWWTMCCNGNMPMGLYEAWKGIVQPSGDGVQVNLLLNRASEWMDVDSYLPYEGKVVLINKTATRAYVRMPRWVDRRAVRCRANGKQTPCHWLGNSLVIDRLKPKDSVVIDFPVVESREKHTEPSYGTTYDCYFKGNTLVDISPRPDRPARAVDFSDDGRSFEVKRGYPLYLRDHYRANKAPMKTAARHVAGKLI